MKLIINTKTKKEEKALKSYLREHDIPFTLVEDEAVTYKTKPGKPLTAKEKKILNQVDQSVEFVNKFKKGKTKNKSANQLLNEL